MQLYRDFPNSRLSLNTLLKITFQQNIFKKSVDERAKKVGKVRYLGWRHTFHQKDLKVYLFINLYFKVQGQKYPDHRNDYLLVIKFPYKKGLKNFKRLYDAPMQIFASDPSFIFFGDAYILKNSYDALVYDDLVIKRFVDYAIKHPPNIRNPQQIPYLTKHAFKLIMKWLANEKPARILTKDKKIPANTRIQIPNTLPKSKNKRKKQSPYYKHIKRKKK